jgi:hypothetical protein
MARHHPSSSSHSPPRHSASTPPELRNVRIEERTPSYLPLTNGVNTGHLRHLNLNLASGPGEGAGSDWVIRAHRRAPRRGSVSLEAQRAGDDVLAALGLLPGSAGGCGNGGGNGNGGGRGYADFNGDTDSETGSEAGGKVVILYHDDMGRRGRRGTRTRRSERESERERDRRTSYLDCARCIPQRGPAPPHPLHPTHCTHSHNPTLLPSMRHRDPSFAPRERRPKEGEYIRLRPGGEKALVRPKKKARKYCGLGAYGTVDEVECGEVWRVCPGRVREVRVRVV